MRVEVDGEVEEGGVGRDNGVGDEDFDAGVGDGGDDVLVEG